MGTDARLTSTPGAPGAMSGRGKVRVVKRPGTAGNARENYTLDVHEKVETVEEVEEDEGAKERDVEEEDIEEAGEEEAEDDDEEEVDEEVEEEEEEEQVEIPKVGSTLVVQNLPPDYEASDLFLVRMA